MTNLTPDALSRLRVLEHAFPAAPGATQSITLGYTRAGQIETATRTNPAYGWTGGFNVSRTEEVNGLNQLTARVSSAGGTTPAAHDARGNLTALGDRRYGYSAENLLTAARGTGLGYDPLLRLDRLTEGSAVTRFVYDGLDLVGEYDANGTRRRRYVHGTGSDEPVTWHEGAERRWLHADERGSVIAVSNAAGQNIATNSYDEYGVPDPNNVGRFGYTGQTWLAAAGLWYYKARMYAPGLGRFLQTDPIGYGDGMNLYGYVGGDPVNSVDPSGQVEIQSSCRISTIVQAGDSAPNYGSSCTYGSGGGGGSELLSSGRAECNPRTASGRQACAAAEVIGPEVVVVAKPQIQQVALTPPQQCVQSAQNAANLDYSQRLFKVGTQTSQDHILERHLSETSDVSQYSTSGGFDAIRRTNEMTYRYGIQSFDRGSVVFDIVHPFSWLGFTTGTNASGGDAYTNHLVVLPDCKTVITSYPR